MGKNKTKKKFKPVDVNKLPNTSSATTRSLKRPNDSVNTSSELSDSSRSVDNASIQFEGNISSEAYGNINDSCQISSTNQQTNENTTTATQQCSDDVTGKLENVTLNSWDNRRNTTSSYPDHDGNGGNYCNKPTDNPYRTNRSGHRNQSNQKNQNPARPKYPGNVRNSKMEARFNENRNLSSDEGAQMPEDIRQDEKLVGDVGINRKSYCESSSGPSKQKNQNLSRSKYPGNVWNSKKEARFNENRNFNSGEHAQMPDGIRQDENLVVDVAMNRKSYCESSSGRWRKSPLQNNTCSEGLPHKQNTKEDNWDEDGSNEQESYQAEAAPTDTSNKSWEDLSLDNIRMAVPENHTPETELNVQAQTFVPNPPRGRAGRGYANDESDEHFSNSHGDSKWGSATSYPQKNSERNDWDKRKSSGPGDSRWSDSISYPKTSEGNDWDKHKPYSGPGNVRRSDATSYSKRRSEGNWDKSKDYSSRGDRGRSDAVSYPKRNSEGNSWDKHKFYSDDARTTRQGRDLFDRHESDDVEYRKFQDEEKKIKQVEFVRVSEIQQDLFAMANDYSLAHCVAEDLRMGSGIAVNFKRDFKDIDVLLNQRQKQGGLAILDHKTEDGVRYIYYLVTKRVSNGKPTYGTLWSSLKKMRDHMVENKVGKLAIPRLGCGLDRLEWSRVKHMIEFLFKELDVEITVCNFQQSEDTPDKLTNQTCKVVNVAKPVADIEEETVIIYLSTEDGHVSSEMEQLDKKFSFMNEFKRERKQAGVPIKFQVPNKYYILYGCIVRKTQSDPFDFVSFRKCVSQIDKACKRDRYVYVAFQAVEDENDALLNEKIITILRNYLHKIDVYVCWDGDLALKMPM